MLVSVSVTRWRSVDTRSARAFLHLSCDLSGRQKKSVMETQSLATTVSCAPIPLWISFCVSAQLSVYIIPIFHSWTILKPLYLIKFYDMVCRLGFKKKNLLQELLLCCTVHICARKQKWGSNEESPLSRTTGFVCLWHHKEMISRGVCLSTDISEANQMSQDRLRCKPRHTFYILISQPYDKDHAHTVTN